MTSSEHDPVVNRAIDELRRLPALDRNAVQRVVQAAAAARVSPADETEVVAPIRTRSVRMWSAIGLAAAAAVVGFVVGGARLTRSEPTTTVALAQPRAESVGPVRQVALPPSDALPVPQQFVLENQRAQRVSVVGDFNNWDPKANRMTRGADGVWSTVMPIAPGRHVYGFMINDTLFALDPRKPKTRDPDLGGEGSVLMVGRP